MVRVNVLVVRKGQGRPLKKLRVGGKEIPETYIS